MSSTKTLRNPRPLVERAGWAVFWNAAFFPIKLILPFLASIVVVRLLRIEGFSTLSIATGLLTGLGLFADLGIERTLPRFYPEVEMQHGRTGVTRLLFAITVVKGVVILLLVAALAMAPGYWIDQFDLGSQGSLLLVIVGLLLILGAASDVTLQLLYTHFRQKATNLLDVLAAVVNPTLRALFVIVGWGVVGAMLALLITTIISVVISTWLAWQLLKSMPDEPHPNAASVRIPSNRPLRTRLVSFAALNYLINWTAYLYDLQFIVLAIPLIILSPEETRVEVAIIALAYQFTKQFLRGLVVPLTGIQTPLFARLYAEGRIEGLRTAYATLTKFLILILLPSGVGLILTARSLLLIIYGQRSRDAVLTQITTPEAVACTAILTVGLFGEAIISVALNVLMVYEEYRSVIIARLAALVCIPLLVLLVPPFGAVGAALAAAIAALTSRLLALGFALRRLELPFPGRFFSRVGAACIAMSVGVLPVLVWLPPDWLGAIVAMVVGAVVFYAAFRLLGGIDREDKDRFQTLRIPFASYLLRFL